MALMVGRRIMAEVALEESSNSGRGPGDLAAYHLSRSYPADYWDEAVCATVDTDIFFPERAGKDQPHISQVKAICMECPIRAKCLEFALRENQQHGVWGGMTYRERLQMKKLLNG